MRYNDVKSRIRLLYEQDVEKNLWKYESMAVKVEHLSTDLGVVRSVVRSRNLQLYDIVKRFLVHDFQT
jgi:hypothetical protein